jgi:hypothetical protein
MSMMLVGALAGLVIAGFAGLPWWFAVVCGLALATGIMVDALVELQAQRGLASVYHVVLLDDTRRLLPTLTISLCMEYCALFLATLLLARFAVYLMG